MWLVVAYDQNFGRRAAVTIFKTNLVHFSKYFPFLLVVQRFFKLNAVKKNK